jgi:3-dehydroquinate synthase
MFSIFETNAAALAGGDKPSLAEAVRVSCVEGADRGDRRDRAGRAGAVKLGAYIRTRVERANEYRPSLLHGEGVGAGMAMALRYSVKLGVCPGQDAVRAERLLNALALRPVSAISAGPYKRMNCWRTWRSTRKPAWATDPDSARGIGQAYIQRDGTSRP